MTRMFLGIRSFACLERNGYLYYIRDDSTTYRTDNTERKERGYHMSALQIVEDLTVFPALQRWYQERYYPEIVNGILHAWKHHYPALACWLLDWLEGVSGQILSFRQIPPKIKIRCAALRVLRLLHFM